MPQHLFFFLSFFKLPGSKGMRRPSWRPTVPPPVGVTPISCTRSRTHASSMADMESVTLASRSCTRSQPHRRRRQGARRKALSQQRQWQSRAANSLLPTLIDRSIVTILFHSCIHLCLILQFLLCQFRTLFGQHHILSILMITT